MNNRGITITNYLTTGDPEGVVFAYISNWTGQAIKIPRNLFSEAKDLSELNRPGIYFLLGTDVDNPDDKLVYVGEANILKDRIIQHLRDADKSFAETIICFSSKDENLTVSHTKYLEQKLIAHIGVSTEFRMVNRKEGSLINLPKMVQDEMDTFLDFMRIILPSMGYSVLHVSKARAEGIENEIYTLQIGALKATAKLTTNGIEVQEGSEMGPKQVKSFSEGYSNLRSTLQEKGIVKERDQKLVFTKPYEFPSPSTAAAVIMGYSINGRTAWKNRLGKSLKEVEEEKILF